MYFRGCWLCCSLTTVDMKTDAREGGSLLHFRSGLHSPVINGFTPEMVLFVCCADLLV